MPFSLAELHHRAADHDEKLQAPPFLRDFSAVFGRCQQLSAPVLGAVKKARR